MGFFSKNKVENEIKEEKPCPYCAKVRDEEHVGRCLQRTVKDLVESVNQIHESIEEMTKAATAMSAKVESFSLRMRMEKLAPGAVKGLIAGSKVNPAGEQNSVSAVSKKEISEIQETLKGIKVMGNFQSANVMKINKQNSKM